ncbi:carboxypeptidase regulatory-like domain-containing protein [Bremerella sp. JC770]|uniref:carboxypeptidase regulatory-like domain-containing protein n=1 Tax=Bremerella sp. JC770 TaxID=3232137 RepID=UPI00345A5BDD
MKSSMSLILLAVLALLGCSSGNNSDLGQVEGRVSLDGKPLPNAQVQFQPTQGRPSYGMTDSEGKFTLQYTGTAAGALIGSHTVLVTTAVSRDDGSVAPELVPPKYNARSELEKEVQAGDNQFDFELASK